MAGYLKVTIKSIVTVSKSIAVTRAIELQCNKCPGQGNLVVLKKQLSPLLIALFVRFSPFFHCLHCHLLEMCLTFAPGQPGHNMDNNS